MKISSGRFIGRALACLSFLTASCAADACTWNAKTKTWSCAADRIALSEACLFEACNASPKLVPVTAQDCIKSACSGSLNFPRDLYGPEDTRNLTWGHADSATLPIKFNPPAGYRVKILSIQGDLVSWPKVMPGDTPVSADRYAGVLIGFSTTEAEGSTRADYFADQCFLYLQDGIHAGEARRTPFTYTHVDRLLGSDSVLALKLAAFLNTTGKPIHMEGTATVKYIFQKD